MNHSRQPAVAGLFYPANPSELRSQVQAMLHVVEPVHSVVMPKALVVPHAGYVYSGPVAAEAYARLTPLAGCISRVVLLGPAHRAFVRGLALPQASVFVTPMGPVELDQVAVAAISSLPQVVVSDEAHALEHSLEVHLPFLQTVLGEFKLLPLVVGRATPEEVAQVLACLWGGPETLVVISSDLSHFLPYDQARQTDADTVERILQMKTGLNHEQACGASPINGLLAFAAGHPLRPELIDLRNSGDTARDKSRVVGYASIAFYEQEAESHVT